MSEEAVRDKVRQLHRLCRIGANRTWLSVMECFGWREFRHRKQVGVAGLTPTP
jgi:hypothetical protein